MSSASDDGRCGQTELVSAYALRALPSAEAMAVEAHLSTCSRCRQELDTLRPIIDSFAAWPIDVLRPSSSLWDRLLDRIAPRPQGGPTLSARQSWSEPEWEEAAPGISCKLLSSDPDRDRVSMLVRLAPGVAYPPHSHAGVEELHLLDGELWIDDRKLYPGDYNRAEPGTADRRVWSETGCTCLLITSPSDVLR
ncbi:MAG: cupin domain-containing protein [Steroidobacteraceae bacterium]